MPYTLYGAPGSGSGIIEAACAEMGIQVVLRALDAQRDEHRGAAYAASNPQRKLPALVAEDGEVLTESVAILVTLDERHRGAGLLPPPGSPERAQALRWMVFAASELYPLVELIDYPGRFASGAAAETLRARAEGAWRERWRVLEGQIAGSPYLLATGFCAADLYLTKLSVWLDGAWRRDHLPRIDALTGAVLARPALAEVWARHVRGER